MAQAKRVAIRASKSGVDYATREEKKVKVKFVITQISINDVQYSFI